MLFLEVGFAFDEPWQAILYILCGLGIFLYGINTMSGSLKKASGGKLRVIIEKSTSTPLKGMIVGFLVTMLTQSASGTSALAVSLVASGLLSFGSSLGVLLGANIGGTILTIVLAGFSQLKIMPIVSVVLVFLGATGIFFLKQKKAQKISSVILGFGLIFLGLAFIDMATSFFLDAETNPASSQYIKDMFQSISGVPVLGILVGTFFTVIVQSSSATIGIVQSMYQLNAINLSGALAIMLGANIGTTVTALLASLGSSKAAKKVAIANSFIKIFGVICFGLLFFAFEFVTISVADAFNWNGQIVVNRLAIYNPMIIALAHLVFNIINSFVVLFLLKPLMLIINKMIKEEDDVKLEEQLLDYSLISKSSSLALSFVKKAVTYMSELVYESIKITKKYVFDRTLELKEQSDALEVRINLLDARIHDYLVKLTITDLNKNNGKLLSNLLDAIKDLERVGDQAINIMDFFYDRNQKGMHLSEDGKQDLHQIFDDLINLSEITTNAIANWDPKIAQTGEPIEEEIDSLMQLFHDRHIHRIETGTCQYSNAEHYVETLVNIERMGDHLINICFSIINETYCENRVLDH